MILSHLEINFQRLLAKSVELAEKQEGGVDWRLVKYVSSLENYLKQLNKLTANKPSVDRLKDYEKRIEFLKQLSNLNSKKPIDTSSNKPSEPNSTIQLSNPGPIITKNDVKPKQLYHKTNLNQENILRQQLLGNKKSESGDYENLDLNKLLVKEQENQEKIANEMLKSVRSIKENSLLANRILKSDKEVLNDLNSAAEKNTDNLKMVNDDLSVRVARSCSCWNYLIIMLIVMVFIMVILFMKLFPKRKYTYDSYGSSSSVSSGNLGDYGETYTHFLNNKTIVIDNKTIHTIEL